MYEEPSNVFTIWDLKKLINSSNAIAGSITIRGEHLEELTGVQIVRGDLGLMDSGVRSLGQLREVTGNFWVSNHIVKPKLQSLCELKRVSGNVGLRYSGVRDLGKLESVGGDLSLRDTQVQHLGTLAYVGGNLFLPKRLEGKLDFSSVTIKGKIRYWNDSKTVGEHASKHKGGLIKSDRPVPYWEHRYVNSTLDLTWATQEQITFCNYFKDSFLHGVFINTQGNSNYEFVLLYDLLDHYNSFKDLDELQKRFENLGSYYPRTEPYCARILCDIFLENGVYERAWEVKKSLGVTLTDVYEFELRLGRRLLDAELLTELVGSSHLTSFGQTHLNEIVPLSEVFLKEFEDDRGVSFFETYFQRDAPLEALNTEEHPFSSFDQEAPLTQLRLFLRRAEDSYRESIGLPKIGEGWISETELFYEITKAFSQYEVVHHGRPKWLGNQHLDIYLPQFNIGIEYQGKQHYTSIDFFGGDEGLRKTLERDEKKRTKCAANRCALIYVKEDDSLEDVILEIQQNINSICVGEPRTP